jgi:2-polyprenyl-3-methyl-5-hydroxy-6-metoxy-1,4-benzoquinol methylase
MNKAKVLPLYEKLTRYEKFILKTCFRVNDSLGNHKNKAPERPDDLVLRDSIYLTKKYLGQDFFAKLNGLRVLDFGCGRGNFTIAMAKEIKGGTIVGYDLRDRYTYASYPKEKLTSEFTFAEPGNLKKLKENKFDVILSWDSFEHFEQPEEVVDEMISLLNPGGKIYIKFGPTWMGPYGRHMHRSFRKDRPWLHLVLGEKHIMRVYSAVRGLDYFKEKWSEFPDGLNQMTLKKAKDISQKREGVTMRSFKVVMYSKLKYLQPFFSIPILKELASESVIIELVKTKD